MLKDYDSSVINVIRVAVEIATDLVNEKSHSESLSSLDVADMAITQTCLLFDPIHGSRCVPGPLEDAVREYVNSRLYFVVMEDL